MKRYAILFLFPLVCFGAPQRPIHNGILDNNLDANSKSIINLNGITSTLLTVTGAVNVTGPIRGASGGVGDAFYVGNDLTISDTNTVNTAQLSGHSNAAIAGLQFGTSGPTIANSGTSFTLSGPVIAGDSISVPVGREYEFNLSGASLAHTYTVNGYAGVITQSSLDGSIVLFTAPSGTAGNTATLTEQLRITTGGVVSVAGNTVETTNHKGAASGYAGLDSNTALTWNGGTPIKWIKNVTITAVQTVNIPASIAAEAYATTGTTLSGTVAGDTIIVTPPSNLRPHLIVHAVATGGGGIDLTTANPTNGALSPFSSGTQGDFLITVIHW